MKPLFRAIPCLIALPALAQPGGPMPVLELAGYLGLTPAQHEQLHKLLEARRPGLEARRFQADQTRRALRNASSDPDLGQAQLTALCAAEARAHQDEVLEAHAVLKEALTLLTQEQAAKYRKAQADLPLMREVMRGGPERRDPSGMPPPPREGKEGRGPQGPDRREPSGMPPPREGQEGPQGPGRS